MADSAHRILRTATIGLVVAALASGCASTSGKAELQLQSEGRERAILCTEYLVAAFTTGSAATAVYLSDVPLADLIDGSATTAQVVHIELLWTPRPGYTPIEAAATNASIRYIVLVDGEIGIYGGAGFVAIKGDPTGSRIKLSIEDASMDLLEATPNFRDRISPGNLRGDVVAVRDEEHAKRLRLAISQRITDVFGEPRIVMDAPVELVGPCQPCPLCMAIDGDQAPTMSPTLTRRCIWRWPFLTL